MHGTPWRLVLPLLMAACTPDFSQDADPGDAVAGDDTAAPPVDELQIGDQPPADPWIFSWEALHTIDIHLPAESIDALTALPYVYAPGDVVLDGVAVDGIGVRLRGKIGSFRTLAGKPKFKLDFNQYVDGQRFQGLESLSLNNSVVDCSYLKEPLAYAVLDAAGAPAARTSYAEVTVNGEPYGLYVVVETQDDRFLRANWDDGSGNLYDGKYVWYGERDYVLLDFAEGHDDLYQLEEGEDVGHADIAAVSAALAAHAGQADFYAALGEVVDWEALHRVWAGEQWVGQNDGYCLNKNNYRLYFDPADGKVDMVPWDMDYSFLHDSDWGRSWASPRGNLARFCFVDATCRARHREVVAELLDTIDRLDLAAMNIQLANLTEAAAYADPRRECSRSNVDGYRYAVTTWLRGRSDEVREAWEL